MLGELFPTGGGDPIPFLKPKLLVGRRESCDISLRFPNVSSHHCELELINGYWRVRDLGSRNGTKVNGIRIESTWLLPGDELSVAKHSYEVRYSAAGEVPPPEVEDIFSMSLLEKAGLARREETPSLDETQNLAGEELNDDEAAMRFLNENPAKPPTRSTPPTPSAGQKNGAAPNHQDTPPVKRVRQNPPPARPEPPARGTRCDQTDLDEPVATRWVISDDD